MFLQELNERERKNFLELAYYVMKVDGTIDPKELNIFNNFRAEMFLSEDSYAIKNKELKTIITELNASRKSIKKIILIELMGIVLSNDEYHEKEADVIEEIKKAWNLRDYEVKKTKRWVEDFNDMLKEAYMFIGE